MKNDKDIPNGQHTDSTGDLPAVGGLKGTSRRKFGKSAIGAAVLLSVGNRVAWGWESNFNFNQAKKGDKPQAKYAKDCISQRVWESYKTGSPSHSPDGKIAKEIEQFQQFSEDGWSDGERVKYFVKDEGAKDAQLCAVKKVSGSSSDVDRNAWGRSWQNRDWD